MSTIPNEVPADTLPRPGLWEWVRAHQRAILFGTIAFQMVVLGSMIARSTWTLIAGETILLRVIPVDPRDLFRGDYVILGYDFTTRRPLGDSQWNEAYKGRDIFVTLVPDADGKHWLGSTVSWERPSSGKFLKGKVGSDLRNEFNIGQFFVQEGKGKEYEDAVRSRRLSAEIAVTDEGAATLKRLVVE
jgi:uncharacterized membrane-anchored protein